MEEINLLELPEIKHVHFIGIGGVSMSGLAEILLSLGYKVSGSDMKASNITQKLEKLGAKIYPYHSEANIDSPDLVVYTVAVKENNPEMVKAKELSIPIIDRAALLGQVMKKYPFSIAVSGTHGKTTTTSMVTMIILESEFDPTVHIGGELQAIGGNTHIGGNKYFITEACEYYESFLKFHPYLAIILNIEVDHVDYFTGLEHIKDTFLKFTALIPNEGYLVACIDDENTASLLDKVSCNIVTYGLNSPNATWSAKDVTFDDMGCATFTLVKDKESISTIKLGVPGLHNVSNSLAAIASCYTLGCDIEAIKHGLARFTGTHKRFEFKGVVDNIKVIDDYAHHPSEVKATLKAAMNCGHSKVWCVFQPHTYTRTKAFLDEFAQSFSDADVVILADIYAAREIDTGEVNSSMLAEKIRSTGKEAIYLGGFDPIAKYLVENASPGDLIITMGAGDIVKVADLFLKNKGI
ncbi:MAG: UDP-N-acetylmuramate--L-alanine ligase [Clostridia bacterium]|nr:UDP-N-acetylmuramate--L-alanine ligase [Clostridia bacterium]